MKFIFVIVFLIPMFVFSQNSQKNVSRKQSIKGLQKTADSINRLLNMEIESYLENKATHQIELEKLYQKQEKIQLAIQYLKKAEGIRKTGFIISAVTASTLSLPFILEYSESKSLTSFFDPPDFIIDVPHLALVGAAGLVVIGQMINIPLQSSATNNIQKARGLISKTNILSN